MAFKIIRQITVVMEQVSKAYEKPTDDVGLIEHLFKLSEHNTTVKTELMAGLTTFVTMSYIMFLNPIIMSKQGCLLMVCS